MKKIIFLLFLSFTMISQASSIKDDETVLFFPSNAYLNGRIWIIPIHGWIFEQEDDSWWRRMMLDNLPSLLEIEPNESNREIYKKRAQLFLVDNQRGKDIDVEMLGKQVTMKSSQSNGHFYGEIHINDKGYKNWQSFQAITKKKDTRIFQGKVQFIRPIGISVISDIDDTIKISNVRDKQALLHNTFFKEFEAVPAMSQVYQSWQQQGAVFHYLSASPWHLYPPLADFIARVGFPDGSYHLKNFRVKDQTFFNLFSSQQAYKKPLVEKLLKKYPQRQFILVGDAGEEDPEIFATIAKLHPQQVLHIFIRDLNSQENKKRYQKTFAGISQTTWSLFKEGNDLLDFKFK